MYCPSRTRSPKRLTVHVEPKMEGHNKQKNFFRHFAHMPSFLHTFKLVPTSLVTIYKVHCCSGGCSRKNLPPPPTGSVLWSPLGGSRQPSWGICRTKAPRGIQGKVPVGGRGKTLNYCTNSFMDLVLIFRTDKLVCLHKSGYPLPPPPVFAYNRH